jgi:hypothetical protein
MDPDWRRFFLQFCIAFVAFVLLAQLAGTLLARVPLRRDEIDDLALWVRQDHAPHRIVLFGDSATRQTLKVFSVGTMQEVVDLTADAHYGLSADVLLLGRYLRAHPAPEIVVLSNNPAVYTTQQDVLTYRHTLWGVFDGDDERRFLAELYPSIGGRDRFPVAFNIEDRLVDPLKSLFVRAPPALRPLGADPAVPDGKDTKAGNEANAATIDSLRRQPMTLLRPNARALNLLCDLSMQYGFAVDLVWVPSPAAAVDDWNRTGKLAALSGQIANAMKACRHVSSYNANIGRAYRAFDLLGRHLRGRDQQRIFANDLRRHLAQLRKP